VAKGQASLKARLAIIVQREESKFTGVREASKHSEKMLGLHPEYEH
jgi:hypothetical protein